MAVHRPRFRSIRHEEVPIPLKADLRDLERYLRSLEERLAQLTGGEGLGDAASDSGVTLLAAHARSHASTVNGVGHGSDPIDPYLFYWKNRHGFNVTPVGTTHRVHVRDTTGSQLRADYDSDSYLDVHVPNLPVSGDNDTELMKTVLGGLTRYQLFPSGQARWTISDDGSTERGQVGMSLPNSRVGITMNTHSVATPVSFRSDYGHNSKGGFVWGARTDTTNSFPGWTMFYEPIAAGATPRMGLAIGVEAHATLNQALTAPSNPLTVNDATGISQVRISSGNALTDLFVDSNQRFWINSGASETRFERFNTPASYMSLAISSVGKATFDSVGASGDQEFEFLDEVVITAAAPQLSISNTALFTASLASTGSLTFDVASGSSDDEFIFSDEVTINSTGPQLTLDDGGSGDAQFSYASSILTITATDIVLMPTTAGVGINEASPDARLHITGTGTDHIKIEHSGSEFTTIRQNVGIFEINVDSSDDLVAMNRRLFLGGGATTAALQMDTDAILHVFVADTTAVADADADDIVFELGAGGGNYGLSFLADALATQSIYFGDNSDPDRSRISSGPSGLLFENEGGGVTASLTLVGGSSPFARLKHATTGATADTDADDVVIEFGTGAVNFGMSLLAGSTSAMAIYFGDSTDPDHYRITAGSNTLLLEADASLVTSKVSLTPAATTTGGVIITGAPTAGSTSFGLEVVESVARTAGANALFRSSADSKEFMRVGAWLSSTHIPGLQVGYASTISGATGAILSFAATDSTASKIVRAGVSGYVNHDSSSFTADKLVGMAGGAQVATTASSSLSTSLVCGLIGIASCTTDSSVVGSKVIAGVVGKIAGTSLSADNIILGTTDVPGISEIQGNWEHAATFWADAMAQETYQAPNAPTNTPAILSAYKATVPEATDGEAWSFYSNRVIDTYTPGKPFPYYPYSGAPAVSGVLRAPWPSYGDRKTQLFLIPGDLTESNTNLNGDIAYDDGTTLLGTHEFVSAGWRKLLTSIVPAHFSVTTGVTAGTTGQGSGVLVSHINEVTTAGANDDVTLPLCVAGRLCAVINNTGNTIDVYPATGAAINDAAANALVTVVDNAVFVAWAISSTKWYGGTMLFEA